MRKPVVLMLLVLLAQPLAAQSVSEERATYDAELNTLRNDDPAKFAQMRALTTFMAEILLGRLGYSVGPFDATLDDQTKKAIREYEKRRGLPITGDPITFETFDQVQKDMKALEYQPVMLPTYFAYVDSWNEGYFNARGTWVLSGERMAWPEQAVEFTCDRSTGTCLEVTASIRRAGDTPSLSVESESYEIERWDANEIVTKPRDYGCTRYVKRANRVQKSVTGVRSTISDDEACRALDANDKLMVLSDGIKVYMELMQEKRKANENLMLVAAAAKKALALE